MTNEEKLQHFQEVCLEDAAAHFKKAVTDYRKSLESNLAEHKEDSRRQQEVRFAAEADKISRETKRKLSSNQVRIRREIVKKQEELKDRLFEEVAEKLAAYRKTPAYRELLLHQIAEIRKTAGKEACEIYLSAGDGALLESLPKDILLSDNDFLGGTIAVIPSRNIFIDNSFRSRMEKERHGVSLLDGGSHGQQ